MNKVIIFSLLVTLMTLKVNAQYNFQAPTFQTTLNCHVNVNEYSSQNFRNDIKRATFKFTSEYGGCTGTLINRNTPENELGNYFITSWHCFKSGSACGGSEFDFNNKSITLTFNYQSPNNQSSTFTFNDGTSFFSNTNGNQFQITRQIRLVEKVVCAYGDFALCEILGDPIPPYFNVYYAGWNPNTLGLGFQHDFASIHHSGGSLKKITTAYSLGGTSNTPALTCSVVTSLIDIIFGWIWKRRWSTQVICSYTQIPFVGTKYKFRDFLLGTLEEGASGAGLFTNSNRLIGNYSAVMLLNHQCNVWVDVGTSLYGKFADSYKRQSVKNILNPSNNLGVDLNGIPGRQISCYNVITIGNSIFGNRVNLWPASSYQQNSQISMSSQTTFNTLGNVIVRPQANYVFNASNSVNIEPGFETQANVVFQAQIQPCSVSNSTYKSANNKSSTNSEYETPDLAEVLESIAVPKNKFFDITKFKHSQSKATNYYNDSIFLKTDIYPNPSSNIVKIESYFKEKISHIYICIYDINGKLVSTNKIFNNLYYLKTVLNISNLQNGMYNLVIYADNHSLSKHIVVLK